MIAPTSAYKTSEDGNLLKLPVAEGSKMYYIYIAKFLKGTPAQGGYSAAADSMRQQIKQYFHLDELLDIREGGTTIGFIGAVQKGGSNEKYHNAVRRSGCTKRYGAASYELLNDAGLNTLPYAAIDSVRSRFANVIVMDISVTSAFYGMTDNVEWELKKGTSVINSFGLGSIPQRTAKSYRVGYYDASSNANKQVASGETLNLTTKATNAEGTLDDNTSIVTLPRVLWEASQGRPEWHYLATEPNYMRDISNAPLSMVDLYEADTDKFANLSTVSTSVPVNPPAFYKGEVEAWPTMSAAAAAGWYYCADLALYTGNSAWASRAVYVDSNGKAKYYKNLTDPHTQLVLGMRMTDAATESDRPSNTYRTIELYAEVRGAWHEMYPTIRVRVGFYGTPPNLAAMDATVITDRNGNEVDHYTNLTGLNINTNLTQAAMSYNKTFEQVYRTQKVMTQFEGTKYYDVNGGRYYKLNQTENKWSVVCLDAAGAEHPFEGDIIWEGGAVDISVNPA